ncbi:SDR family oxidoreductase [Prosthecochloris sp. SCSIO W1101]|uniref:SDR family NAD(P)-dependent oxidoreductase n=1 Tax=Prosthecochloris sp. SCSIO W1101 TaxID=2992242 RepID=UPI00223E377F|nr:SDR family oxidoreductase [Prosthecochloris sp. SCSIO W1101]UZJ42563.1 SDR family oxidoreductase [Prosthecochloris sp. SCSIO W1101]
MDLPHTESQRVLGIVITGGSRGLGYALAREFLLKGDRVIISGRNPEHLEHAVESLKAEIRGCEIYGICMDVGNPEKLDLFSSFIITRLGQVDRWINNAGTSGLRKAPLCQLEASDILETCTTNLAGSMLMSKIATEIMSNQPSEDIPSYHIFNMGFSTSGAKFSRSNIPHKASKLGVAAISHFLCRELHEQGIRGIGIHELSPGLVKTDLLLRDTSPETKEFLDLIAESPEKVARKLVPKIRAANGRKSHIRYRSIAGMGLHALMQLSLKKVGNPLREMILDLSSRKRGDEPL